MGKTVLTFGSFDPLHEGHLDMLAQARSLGERLIVVVARDAVIRSQKRYEPFQSEIDRLQCVSAVAVVDQAVLGDMDPSSYGLLASLEFDVLAVGYDQKPDDADIYRHLVGLGKSEVAVARLKPYRPEDFKSSFLRTGAQ